MTANVQDSPRDWVKRHIDRYIESGDENGHLWRGAPKHPSWYLNLTANSEVEVQVGDEVFTATARTADPVTRVRLWPRMVELWPDFENYVQKTDREIPVVLLAPDYLNASNAGARSSSAIWCWRASGAGRRPR